MRIFSFLIAFFAIHLLPAQTLQTVIQRGHDQAVLSVATSPDSNYVASGKP
jgi:WD40 repeat protein